MAATSSTDVDQRPTESQRREHASLITFSAEEFACVTQLGNILGEVKYARILRKALRDRCAEEGIDPSPFDKPLRRAPRQARGQRAA